MAFEASANIGMLMGGVIVDDGVDRLLSNETCFSITLRKRMNS